MALCTMIDTDRPINISVPDVTGLVVPKP